MYSFISVNGPQIVTYLEGLSASMALKQVRLAKSRGLVCACWASIPEGR